MEERAEELHPFIRALIERRRQLMYGVLILALLFLGGYRLSTSRSIRKKGDFYRAALEHIQIQKSAETQEALARLQECLKRNSQLCAKYDGSVAQALLAQEDPKKAEIYAKRALKRTAKQGGDYNNFARTTLLISKGNYPDALVAAEKLQTHLNTDVRENIPYGHLLRAYNQMRIALLQGELGNQSGEKTSWQELLSWMESNAPEGSAQRIALDQFAESFHEGQISVREFAKSRLARL